MTICFAGSIRGGRGDQAIYEAIIERLRQYGDDEILRNALKP